MELTKQDTQMAKGMASLGMVMLHLFCRLGELPYTPLIWCKNSPLIYYLGLFGDLCVPVYCFCRGYAHYLMADSQKKDYVKRLPNKALRFLTNYWIVVILFSLVGLHLDQTGKIPGSRKDFFANLFLISTSYNGAWWFVMTYLILLFLSKPLAELTKHSNCIVLLIVSFAVYFAAYQIRFNHDDITFINPVIQWFWRQTILLGTSQFGYLIGMVCRKCGWINSLKLCLQDRPVLRRLLVCVLPTAAFLGHCIVQSAFVAPFTACAALAGLFLVHLPHWAGKCFLILGKHSTNIWLVHMFFFSTLLPNFIFFAKYPVLILGVMLAICYACSIVIDFCYRPILAMLAHKK